MFSTKFTEIVQLVKTFIKRCFDRQFSYELKGDDKEINTQLYRQKDVHDLYTGPQLNSGEKFAQIFNVSTILMMFGMGLPFMYVVGIFSYLFSYWLNKALLIRFYQKTYQFNETLPILSQQFMQLSIFLHIVVTFFMLYNRNLFVSQDSSYEHFESFTDSKDIQDISLM